MLSKLSIENYKPAVKPEKKVRPERYEGEGKFGPRSNFTKIPNRIIADPLMSAKEKIVLIALHLHARQTGRCWPSLPTLQRETGVRYNTILKIIRTLEKKQYLKKHRRHGNSTIYQLSSFGY